MTKYFKGPFKLDHYIGKIWGKDNTMILDFYDKGDSDFYLTKQEQQAIVDCMNGQPYSNENTFSHNSDQLFLNEQPIGFVRGWGYLTGRGGLNLSENDAIAAQSEFLKTLVNKLNQ